MDETIKKYLQQMYGYMFAKLAPKEEMHLDDHSEEVIKKLAAECEEEISGRRNPVIGNCPVNIGEEKKVVSVERLVEELQNKIDYYTKEYDMSLAEVVGSLEVIKHNLIQEELENDE